MKDNKNNSLVKRTFDYLLNKMGFVRLSDKDGEVGYLNERLLGEEKKNRNLHSSLHYYKTNYLKIKRELKVYEELFREIGEKQVGLENKSVIIKVQKKSNKTTKKVVGRKLGQKTGPLDKSDKTLTPVVIDGHTRKYKSGKIVYVDSFTNNYWKKNFKMVG